jgi:hypothetical protein
MKCTCGCGSDAAYLCTFQELFESFVLDEPCCEDSAAYLKEACYEFDLPFEQKECKEMEKL